MNTYIKSRVNQYGQTQMPSSCSSDLLFCFANIFDKFPDKRCTSGSDPYRCCTILIKTASAEMTTVASNFYISPGRLMSLPGNTTQKWVNQNLCGINDLFFAGKSITICIFSGRKDR